MDFRPKSSGFAKGESQWIKYVYQLAFYLTFQKYVIQKRSLNSVE